MKITCLSENTSNSENIFAEHGLSLYIETEQLNILFDTGSSDLFLKNAKALNINLENTDILILSHGHYDHGGGIRDFLKINEKAPIYASPLVFGEHYNGRTKYIGLDKSLEGYERFIYTEGIVRLSENVVIYPAEYLKLPYVIDSAELKIKCGDIYEADNFLHERYLEITENGKKYLFSGCSHRGILNIAGTFDPDVLIGGFHLKNEEPFDENQTLSFTAEKLCRGKTIYYTCHCTGLEQYKVLKRKMTSRLHYLSAGDVIEF